MFTFITDQAAKYQAQADQIKISMADARRRCLSMAQIALMLWHAERLKCFSVSNATKINHSLLSNITFAANAYKPNFPSAGFMASFDQAGQKEYIVNYRAIDSGKTWQMKEYKGVTPTEWLKYIKENMLYEQEKKRNPRFWGIIHNAIAHPLLITGAKWADRFHDWTAGKM